MTRRPNVDRLRNRRYSLARAKIKTMKASKTKINSIEIGDMLHYCPADLDEKFHDIGVVIDIQDRYNLTKKVRVFEIYWQKTNNIICFSDSVLEKKLTKNFKGIKTMKLLKRDE